MNVAYEQQDSREYIHYFSFLRVISMLAVIVIHVISNTIYFYSNYLTDFQLFTYFFVTFSVPRYALLFSTWRTLRAGYRPIQHPMRQ